MGPQVSGRVSEVLVDVGDRVERGQALARIDPAFHEIRVAQREADVKAARIALEDAELNFGRMRNLWEKPGGAEPVFDPGPQPPGSAVSGSGVDYAGEPRHGLDSGAERCYGVDHAVLLVAGHSREEGQAQDAVAYRFGYGALAVSPPEPATHGRQVQRKVVEYGKDIAVPEMRDQGLPCLQGRHEKVEHVTRMHAIPGNQRKTDS